MEEEKFEETKIEVAKPQKKKKTFIILTVIIIAIIIIVYLSYFRLPKASASENIYNFSGNKFLYSQDRGKADYNMTYRSDNKTFTMYNISFYSRNFMNYSTRIYGILLLPNVNSNASVPGIVLLPGGGGTKENELRLASLIADEGIAVLTIDQRGVGQTGGYYLSYQDDYAAFMQGNEPIQHLSVYDALRSYDVLRSIDGVDKNNIAIAGESMGGRYAIIAAALDKRLKGVLGISTSGFHITDDGSNEAKYFMSIDPDNYIKDISPNYIVMLHGGNDTTIPINESRYTFQLAGEPKKFYFFVKCGHGYCKDMDSDIKSGLKLIFGK